MLVSIILAAIAVIVGILAAIQVVQFITGSAQDHWVLGGALLSLCLVALASVLSQFGTTYTNASIANILAGVSVLVAFPFFIRLCIRCARNLANGDISKAKEILSITFLVIAGIASYALLYAYGGQLYFVPSIILLVSNILLPLKPARRGDKGEAITERSPSSQI